MSGDRHEPFRNLLAERLDGPLDAADAARLEAHLLDCPACRSVARDYEVDRERMRAIRAPEPPRDLWARTSAALDRELADDADALLGGGFGGTGSRRQLRVALGSFVTATVILALTGGQLLPDTPAGLADRHAVRHPGPVRRLRRRRRRRADLLSGRRRRGLPDPTPRLCRWTRRSGGRPTRIRRPRERHGHEPERSALRLGPR